MNDTLDSVQRSQASNAQRYATINVSSFRWEFSWMGLSRNRSCYWAFNLRKSAVSKISVMFKKR